MSNNLTFLDKINEYLVSMQSLKTKDKLVFYRLLSTMSNAGIGLVKAVSILEKQEKSPVLKKILGEFVIKLKSGKKLSDCLTDFPFSFGDAEVGIIRSGEKTGKLNSVLVDLADQIEKIESINGKLKGALMYPAFIMLVVVGVISVMMTMVVPKLLEIFDDKSALPNSTKILIGVSDFMVAYWPFIIFSFLIFLVSVSFWKRTTDGKYLFDKMLFKIPVMGNVIQKIILSKFSRVFANLISSGVSMVESLKITSEVVGNEVYRQKILLLAQDVKSGIRIHESLEGSPLFPDMMVQMIQVGEETANLDTTIIKIADFYDEQVDNTISVLNKLLEPFIIVFLATVVGFIAMAIMEPIMNLADTVTNK